MSEIQEAIDRAKRKRLAVAALNEEARRRGMTYGRLVEVLDSHEQKKIIRAYIKRKEAEEWPSEK